MKVPTLIGGVAGVSAPAFVERSPQWSVTIGVESVAGVSAPAFVERRSSFSNSTGSRRCRRGLGPGLR